MTPTILPPEGGAGAVHPDPYRENPVENRQALLRIAHLQGEIKGQVDAMLEKVCCLLTRQAAILEEIRDALARESVKPITPPEGNPGLSEADQVILAGGWPGLKRSAAKILLERLAAKGAPPGPIRKSVAMVCEDWALSQMRSRFIVTNDNAPSAWNWSQFIFWAETCPLGLTASPLNEMTRGTQAKGWLHQRLLELGSEK